MTTDVNAPAGQPGGLGEGAAPATPAPTPSSEPWFSGIQDPDLRGWVEQTGAKDLTGFAKSHKDLMAFRGVPADRLLQIPENWDNAEQVGAFYDKIGRPKSAAEYGIELPEGGDKDFADFMLGMLHEGGANTRQAQRWFKGYQEYAAKRMAADAQAEADQAAADIATLRTEWGGNYGALEEQARRAFRKFGGDAEEMARLEGSMGTAGFLKFFQRVGEQMGESQYVEGDKQPGEQAFGTLSPNGARARKDSLLADPAFKERYFRNDPAAVAEITRLQQMEAAGMEPPVAFSAPGAGGRRA